ncbi:RING finger protein 214-like [Cololabis saira]|uniref:RING finger protein 214-like n=1 Tax=Cololabis saira TaxID=129043 RepID=UPI002AD2FFD5|nr:RING finger protein 214-like [Cololabis saira]
MLLVGRPGGRKQGQFPGLAMDANEELTPGVSPELTSAEPVMKVQAVQTDGGSQSQSAGVQTLADWEEQAAAVVELGTELAEQVEDLTQQQQEKQEELQTYMVSLQKHKEEASLTHQGLLEKLESVRVKLQLNNSKATRKNFLVKKQELNAEKNRVEEERNRLAREMEDGGMKLAALTEEQGAEQRRWGAELQELRAELERCRKEAQDAQMQALREETVAVETQRDVAMNRIEAWHREVSQYLDLLRAESPPRFPPERQLWDHKEAAVRQNRVELQSRYQQVLQQLQQGRSLDALPRISTPALPPVPMADLRFRQVMRSLAPPPPRHFYPRQPLPPAPFRGPYPPQGYFLPPPAAAAAPTTAGPPIAAAGPPLAAAGPPGAAGKLEKVLEKLAVRFPLVSKNQLMAALQQVKSSRGTLKGLNLDQVLEQVGVRLAQGPPGGPGPIQRPGPPVPPGQRGSPGPAPGPAPQTRKLCFMCQELVDPGDRHPLGCSHAIHRACIQPWLQSSRKDCCPFCPGQ